MNVENKFESEQKEVPNFFSPFEKNNSKTNDEESKPNQLKIYKSTNVKDVHLYKVIQFEI